MPLRSRMFGTNPLRSELTQLLGQIARGRKPRVGRLGQTALDDVLQRRRYVGGERVNRPRLVTNDRLQRFAGGALLEGPSSRPQLVEDRAEGELIRRRAYRLTRCLFR